MKKIYIKTEALNVLLLKSKIKIKMFALLSNLHNKVIISR